MTNFMIWSELILIHPAEHGHEQGSTEQTALWSWGFEVMYRWGDVINDHQSHSTLSVLTITSATCVVSVDKRWPTGHWPVTTAPPKPFRSERTVPSQMTNQKLSGVLAAVLRVSSATLPLVKTSALVSRMPNWRRRRRRRRLRRDRPLLSNPTRVWLSAGPSKSTSWRWTLTLRYVWCVCNYRLQLGRNALIPRTFKVHYFCLF